MFKKLFRGAVAKILIIGLAITQVPSGAFAFGNRSHQELSANAYDRALKYLNFEQHLPGLSVIKKRSTGPDANEYGSMRGFYAGHFFNANTDMNERDTALTRLEQHYGNAVSEARAGRWPIAVEELARALHYLQDMCCPVHMWGYSYNNCPSNLLEHKTTENVWDAMWDADRIHMVIPIDAVCREDFRFASVRVLGLHFHRESLLRHREYISRWGVYEFAGSMARDGVRDFMDQDSSYWSKFIGAVSVVDAVGIKAGADLATGTYSMASSAWRTIFKSPDYGFNHGWEDIFVIPYRASYALVKMWVEAVRGFEQPPEGCVIYPRI